MTLRFYSWLPMLETIKTRHKIKAYSAAHFKVFNVTCWGGEILLKKQIRMQSSFFHLCVNDDHCGCRARLQKILETTVKTSIFIVNYAIRESS